MSHEPPKLTYPREWTYAIIGLDEEDLRLLIGRLMKDRRHTLRFSKQSAAKKYVSLHLDMQVESEEDRNQVFVELQKSPGVVSVI